MFRRESWQAEVGRESAGTVSIERRSGGCGFPAVAPGPSFVSCPHFTMALIEGVGDEVTVLFGIVFCFLVLVLAWISTHTAERGEQIFVSVVSTSTARPGGTHRLPEVPTEPVIERAGIEEPKNDREEDTTKLPAPSNGTEPGLPDAVDTTSGTLRHRVRAATPDASSSTLDRSENTHPSEEFSGQAEERVGVAEESMENATADPTMVIRLKFLNDTERLARMRPGDTVSILKRTYFPGQEHQVRLIYQGQLLRDDSQTMSSLHLTDNCVLHCHISQHATPQMPAGTRVADPVNTALNIGSLMVPLFVLMLSLLWYFQIQYRQFFTATATVCLAGVTILFSLMAFTMYRR